MTANRKRYTGQLIEDWKANSVTTKPWRCSWPIDDRTLTLIDSSAPGVVTIIHDEREYKFDVPDGHHAIRIRIVDGQPVVEPV